MSSETLGRTVRLFLVDGNPAGIIAAEIMNWTGHLLVAPRTRLPELLSRTEAGRTGVYFLIGEDSQDPLRNTVYIGESDNVGKRIGQHSRDESKDFWNRLCIMTSKDQNLTKAHVRYLESQLIAGALKSGRATVANGTAPEFGYLPESDRADMDYCLQQISLVLPVLGFDFLKPRAQRPTAPESTNTFGLANQRPISVELVLNSPKHGLRADALYSDDEITVLAGSKALVDAEFTTNFAKALRQTLIEDGTLVLTDDRQYYVFTKDTPFPAPSTAAAVIFDRNSNGRTAWKLRSTGETLKEWQNAQLPPSVGDSDT